MTHQSNLSGRNAKNAPQARLLLGMSGVGCGVILSSIGLNTLSVPQATEPLWQELSQFGSFLLCYVAISLPFDWIGGSLIPRIYHHRSSPPFWRTWTRGALAHALLLWSIAALLLSASRIGGSQLLFATFSLITLALIAAQKHIATTIASFDGATGSTNKEGMTTIALKSDETAFSGGVVGWPRKEQIIQPASWQNKLPATLFEHLLARRALAIKTGLRTRGLIVATAWVAAGLAIALWLEPTAIHNAEGLLRIAFRTTLWQFLGLLILPTLSRQGTVRLDYEQIQQGSSKQQQHEFIRQQSQLEDGETQRSPIVETIFHPLPSIVNRLAELDREPLCQGAWNANRMMLYLNWATLGLLSRAVHCNIGRPSLWVLPPVD